MFKHVPNILTMIRFLLIPFIIYFLATNQYIVGVILFILSGITDVVDGAIARKFNFITDFGKLMDPLADKLTQIATIASLTLIHIIPIWILAIVLLKELIMIAGASFLYGKDVVVYSKWYGKLATVLFYLAIVFSLLINQFELSSIWFNLDLWLFYLALFATVFSLLMYIKDVYKKGFIDKQDLNKEVTIDKKERKKR
jgi:cardiolipin synthase